MSVICAQLRTRTHRGRPHVIRASPATLSRLGLCGDKRQHGPQRGFPHRVQQRRCLRLQPGVAAWLRVGRVYCTQYSYTMKKCAQHHDRGGADRLDNLLHAICYNSRGLTQSHSWSHCVLCVVGHTRVCSGREIKVTGSQHAAADGLRGCLRHLMPRF